MPGGESWGEQTGVLEWEIFWELGPKVEGKEREWQIVLQLEEEKQ